MNDEEDVATYFLQVDEVVNYLKGLGEDVKEKMIVQKVLTSRPYQFDARFFAIEQLKYLDSISMDELNGIFPSYKMRSRN